MATLTEVSVMARNGIKWGTISLIIMALIPGTLSMIKKIYATLNPPPPPPPTVRYGSLPKLIFPEVPGNATPEYKLETVSGSLPALSNVGRVYFVGINKSRLLVLDRMTSRARNNFKLNIGPIQLDTRTFRYQHSNLPIDLIFDVITESFSYKYDWTSNQAVYSSFNVPLKDRAERDAEAFFQKMEVLHDDLANGPVKVVYMTATSSAMIPTEDIRQANFVRIDIFRQNKDDMRIVTSGGDTSPVNVILSSLGSEQKVVQGNYYYSQVIGEDYATYPLKPVDSAWKELVSGGGFIAKRAPENNAVIRNVYLAYFESNEQQSFLQPVYVFEGDAGFMAYVHAIANEYVMDPESR